MLHDVKDALPNNFNPCTLFQSIINFFALIYNPVNSPPPTLDLCFRFVALRCALVLGSVVLSEPPRKTAADSRRWPSKNIVEFW